MISEQTLFILGAGASNPYKYPLGSDLRINIISNLAGDILNLSTTESKDLLRAESPKYINFSKDFYSSKMQLIDYFIDKNDKIYKGYFDESAAIIGKKAITVNIMLAEKDSRAYFDSMKEIEDDWISILFNKMIYGLKKEEIPEYEKPELLINLILENKITFITFNYDRSLEFFLFEAIKSTFNLNSIYAKEILDGIKIIHVFGRFPKLPFETSQDSFDYGYEPSKYLLNIAYREIQTLTERGSIDRDVLIKEISNADRIFFLGFGYHQENLNLLGLNHCLQKRINIYGSALNESNKKVQEIINYFGNSLISFPQRGTAPINTSLGASYVKIHSEFNSSKLLNEYL